MTSTDHEILIALAGEVRSIHVQLDGIKQDITALKTSTQILTQRMDMLEKRFDDLTGYIGNWFTITAVFVAVVGFIVPVVLDRLKPAPVRDDKPLNVYVYPPEGSKEKGA